MINLELLQAAYHNNKPFIDLIGKNRHIQNELRMTDLKMYSVNIEQVFDYFNSEESNIFVSKDDLLKSIEQIKNSIIWNEIAKNK